jgi:regulator of RNase E activity RraA
MGGRVVLRRLVTLVATSVGMDQRRVVVLVLVVVGLVLELAEHPTRVLVGDVIVVVGMDHGVVGMLVFGIARDVLHDR